MSNTPQKLYYCNDSVLLEKEGPRYRIPAFSEAPLWLEAHQIIHTLGMYEGVAIDVVEVTGPTELPHPYTWLALRPALEALYPRSFNLLARAHQVLSWDKNHRYCGRCGAETKVNGKSFERQCASCQLLFYPRISPSIIVLIRKDDKILLARKADFPRNVYGLIAGFVEAGETLEETVHREVYEEVGLRVKNLQYFDSQPWPFPDSLMIAFTADYAGGEIELRDGELEAAAWYKADNLPGLPGSSISIARKLIDNFAADKSNGYRP
ncbi:MAG: nudC [Gammaproteobacteria bacterium]|nr:nudC [Gammaproteobacteria bacterium]